MSDFTVNFDLLGGLSMDEWLDLEDEEKPSTSKRHSEISEKELDALELCRSEPGTVKQTNWSTRCFQTWCTQKKIVTDLTTIGKEDLNKILREFYATVRNAKGAEYSVSSYAGLRAGINRYMNDPPLSRGWSIISDSEFSSSNSVFVAVMKKLRKEGKDTSTHHPSITEADFNTIKQSSALSPATPHGLLHKVWFDIQLHMGRRANEGNRALKPESFVIRRDEQGFKYATLTFNEETKNHKDYSEKNKERLRGFMFEEAGNPLCPVASLEKYLSLLPPGAPAFYLKPKKDYSKGPWYVQRPLGVHYLGEMLPKICRLAGTTVYTNHSIRATTIQKLSDAGLESREIMSVTGHKNESSLQSYWCPNMKERRNWSTILATGASAAGSSAGVAAGSSAEVAAGPQKRPLPMDSHTPTAAKRPTPDNVSDIAEMNPTQLGINIKIKDEEEEDFIDQLLINDIPPLKEEDLLDSPEPVHTDEDHKPWLEEREAQPPLQLSLYQAAGELGSYFLDEDLTTAIKIHGFSKCERLLHAIADSNSDLEDLSDVEDSQNTGDRVPPEREDWEKEDAGQQSSDSDSSDCDEDYEPKSRSMSRGRGRRGSESKRCGHRRQHGQSMVVRARGRGQRKDQEVADKPGTSGRGRKRQRESGEGGPGPSNDGTQPGVEQRDDGETESDEDYVPSGTPEDDEMESAESEPRDSPAPPSSPGRQDVWTNAEFTPNLVQFAAQDDDDGNSQEEREEWQPLDYMEQYIDTELMKVLAVKSNAEYLKRTGKNLNTSADELYHFFGASIFMSCVPYPHTRMYWSNAFKVTTISDKMTRDRFFKLRQNLKVVFDNDISEEERKVDAFWKVRPFMDRILNGCLRQDRPESVSINEQMIPFTGACPYRQYRYVPLKPNPVGLKNFVVASPDGIILDFDVYQGAPALAAQVQDSEGLDLGSLVVERLAKTLPAGTKVYCDRFFTSEKTLDRMLDKKIYVTGTIKKSRIRAAAKKLPSDETMKRQGRGTTAYVTRKDGKACLLKWYDNKPVMMLSTVHAQEPQDTCRRWCKKEGRYIPVIRPSIVREYNAMMGVDLNDRMISYHRMKTRTRKWPLRMTMHFIDLSLANSWLLFRKDQRQRGVPEKRIMQFLEFRMEVARAYLAKQGCDEVQLKQEDDEPHNDRHFTTLPPASVRIASAGHLPEMVDLKNPMRCRIKQCTGKSCVRCITCNVFLCLQTGRNCYAAFHSK